MQVYNLFCFSVKCQLDFMQGTKSSLWHTLLHTKFRDGEACTKTFCNDMLSCVLLRYLEKMMM